MKNNGVVLVSLLLTLNIFQTLSTDNVEQVNADWDLIRLSDHKFMIDAEAYLRSRKTFMMELF